MKISLIAHFPSWMDDGIFKYISEWAPWANDETVSSIALDTEYLGNRSGDRMPSPLLQRMTYLKGEAILSEAEKRTLSDIIKAKYSLNWKRLWDALQEEYNAIENYSMIEETTPGVKTTTKVNTDVEGVTKNNVKSTNTVSSESKVKGFGSTEFKPVTVTDGDSTTEALEGANKSTVTQKGNAESNFTTTEFEGKNTLTRSGNIGVTTSQQMLESEYELRKKNYFDYVMDCVDTVLTIPYWSL